MKWDLYVDESGNFAADKHCLVGGFIVPEGTITRDLVLKWKQEICAIPEISEMMVDLKWKYDHCMRNTYSTKRKSNLRGELQYHVTKEYKKRVQAIDGKFVIFDNSTGIYNTDNTTNFLTVLAKGLMILFYEWSVSNPSIRLHFASRKNITFSDEKDILPISPTRIPAEDGGDQKVILTSQYVAQIRNLAFLQAGQQLLENETFSTMLDNIDIVEDDKVVGENGEIIHLPNPLTVPSDYICNTFIKADSYDNAYQEKIRRLYHSPDVLIYRTDLPLIHAPGELKNMDFNDNHGRNLIRLISNNFPEPETSRFFRNFNITTIGNQKSSINYVVDTLRERIESQETMEELAERLDSTISASNQIENEQIQLCFDANLLLYQESLYTHLGKQDLVAKTRESFKQTVERIEDDSVADNLLDLADNRKLVNLTDRFDYDTAIKEFEDIEKYWTKKATSRRNRTDILNTEPKYPVYGRTIGSYLQVLRHEIHKAPDDDKELYYSEALERMSQARFHLFEPNDVSRFHQNVCDIEAEMGHFQSAFNHLYNSAIIYREQNTAIEQETTLSASSADTILKIAGYGGEIYPYILQHFVRTLSLIYMKNPSDTDAEEMVKPFQSHINEHFVNNVHSLHPRTQIMWKTASFLASREKSSDKQRIISLKLFRAAVDELTRQNQTVFNAIATGILAEMAWHAHKNHIPENPIKIIRELKETYNQFCDRAKSSDTINLFDNEFLQSEPEYVLSNSEKLLRTSLIIGY